MSIASEINRIREEVSTQSNIIEQIETALRSKCAGAMLPELSNEGTADDLFEGKELIDAEGRVVTGTNPYAKVATDTTVNEQASLIDQITGILRSKGYITNGGSN